MMLPRRSKGVEAVEANGHYTGEAIFTRLKAPLDLSIWRFQRSFYTYKRPLWEAPVVRRCFLENRYVWRLWTQNGTVDSDANFTRLKAPLDLSIRRCQRCFYTYKRPLWQALVVRRCFLENRHVWRLGLFGSRCAFHSIE
jgi:hypothetical protein